MKKLLLIPMLCLCFTGCSNEKTTPVYIAQTEKEIPEIPTETIYQVPIEFQRDFITPNIPCGYQRMNHLFNKF